MTPSLKSTILLMSTLMLFGCNLQNRILYYPSPTPPSDAWLQSQGLQRWGEVAGDYRGLLAAEALKEPRGTVVVFHGNGGVAGDRGFYVRELGQRGLRVILAEYPQYGGRPGDLGEEAFVRDGVTTVRMAAAQYGAPLYLLGESLGCGVTAGVVREAPATIAGVMLITPWESLAAVARHHYPLLPASLFLTDSYDSAANLDGYRGPVAVVAAARDTIIPPAQAAALFAALATPHKRLWTLPGAGHNDWSYYAPPSLWSDLVAFISQRP